MFQNLFLKYYHKFNRSSLMIDNAQKYHCEGIVEIVTI